MNKIMQSILGGAFLLVGVTPALANAPGGGL